MAIERHPPENKRRLNWSSAWHEQKRKLRSIRTSPPIEVQKHTHLRLGLCFDGHPYGVLGGVDDAARRRHGAPPRAPHHVDGEDGLGPAPPVPGARTAPSAGAGARRGLGPRLRRRVALHLPEHQAPAGRHGGRAAMPGASLVLGFRSPLRRPDAASRARARALAARQAVRSVGRAGERGAKRQRRTEGSRKKSGWEQTESPRRPPLTAGRRRTGMRARGGRWRWWEGFGGLRLWLPGDDGFSRGFCGGRWGPGRAAGGRAAWMDCYGSHAHGLSAGPRARAGGGAASAGRWTGGVWGAETLRARGPWTRMLWAGTRATGLVQWLLYKSSNHNVISCTPSRLIIQVILDSDMVFKL